MYCYSQSHSSSKSKNVICFLKSIAKKKYKNWNIIRTEIDFIKRFFLSMGTQKSYKKMSFLFFFHQRFKKYSLVHFLLNWKTSGLGYGLRKFFFSINRTRNACLLFIFLNGFYWIHVSYMFPTIYCKKKDKNWNIFRTEIDFFKRFFPIDGYTRELRENGSIFMPAV